MRVRCSCVVAIHEKSEPSMPIYEFASEEIRPLHKTTFSRAQLQERRDLQRLLRANISVVAPDTLVIAEKLGIGTSRAAASTFLELTAMPILW